MLKQSLFLISLCCSLPPPRTQPDIAFHPSSPSAWLSPAGPPGCRDAPFLAMGSRRGSSLGRSSSARLKPPNPGHQQKTNGRLRVVVEQYVSPNWGPGTKAGLSFRIPFQTPGRASQPEWSWSPAGTSKASVGPTDSVSREKVMGTPRLKGVPSSMGGLRKPKGNHSPPLVGGPFCDKPISRILCRTPG